MRQLRSNIVGAIVVTGCCVVCVPTPAYAYVGPGAGFVFLSSFLMLFAGIVLTGLSIVAWPFRTVWKAVTKRRQRPLARRLIIIGFDGQDPTLTDRFMHDGVLPNFSRLAKAGCYSRLKTTLPAVSPVAWSSFSTGTQPGKHHIFDFLDRDRRTYLPVLSSVRIRKAERFVRLGRFQIPRALPRMTLLRRSRPFWSILGDYGIWSTVLRVPVTFPPDKFHGAELSAMCVPDILGTQGTFLLYTTRTGGRAINEGGTRIPIGDGDCVETTIRGPENVFRVGLPPLEIPLRIRIDRARQRVDFRFNGTSLSLARGELSEWVRLKFPAAPGLNVFALSRWLVTEMDEHLSIYMSPLSIDPEHPAMPVSHPVYYSTYLAKRIGPYATLGLAEDTWALNEGVIDEKTFLRQAYDIDAERRAMFFAALDTLREGTLACVFDATDRVQHMFWRYLDGDMSTESAPAPHRNAILDLYRSNDQFLGTVLDRIRRDDVLFVLSDHGFSAFRRGVNLNGWLLQEGYLTLKLGADGSGEWLHDVDWSQTRAYALGLAGLYLNIKGREGCGIVEPSQAEALRAEIRKKLAGLRDADRDAAAIVEVYHAAQAYSGPYVDAAPDLLVGYNAGYRVSWNCAKGVVAGPVISDNDKAWSGDHCIDPPLVPGVLFCNRAIAIEDPQLIDIAPTALHVFGVPVPAHMDGRSLFAMP